VSPSTIGIVCSSIAIHFALREAVLERAQVRRAKVLFPPVMSLRLTSWVGVPLLLFAAYKLFTEMHSLRDWFYPASAIGLALLAFFSPPGTITVNDSEARIDRYWGLKVCKLAWSEVDCAVYSRARNELAIYHRDGRSIVHTRLHVDPTRFSLEVSKRLGKPIIRQ